MKKITFILLALISGTAFAQESASGTADVNVEIVSPITISNGTALNFGTINGTSTGGKVRIANDGTRTFSNTDMQITSPSPVTAAIFSITAAKDYYYSISIPATKLTGDGDSMNVSFTHDRVDVEARKGNGTAQQLSVGGLLTVNDSQNAGAYTGNVEVTVAYE